MYFAFTHCCSLLPSLSPSPALRYFHTAFHCCCQHDLYSFVVCREEYSTMFVSMQSRWGRCQARRTSNTKKYYYSPVLFTHHVDATNIWRFSLCVISLRELERFSALFSVVFFSRQHDEVPIKQLSQLKSIKECDTNTYRRRTSCCCTLVYNIWPGAAVVDDDEHLIYSRCNTHKKESFITFTLS